MHYTRVRVLELAINRAKNWNITGASKNKAPCIIQLLGVSQLLLRLPLDCCCTTFGTVSD